jgi:hypothetical protein
MRRLRPRRRLRWRIRGRGDGGRMSEQLALTLTAASVGLVSAIFFCISGVLNSVERIAEQTTTYWDYSEPLVQSLASQRAQYAVGGLLLLVAFALQVMAALASSTTISGLPQWLSTWPRLLPTVVVPTTLISWFVCGALERVIVKKVLQRHRDLDAKAEAEKLAKEPSTTQ